MSRGEIKNPRVVSDVKINFSLASVGAKNIEDQVRWL